MKQGDKNQYFFLSDHVYVTEFRDELILLDSKEDKYIICLKKFSNLLNNILEKSFLGDSFSSSFNSEMSSQELNDIQKLLDSKIVEIKNVPYPFYIDKKPISEGVENVDWRLPLESKKIRINSHVLKAFITLIKVNYSIKFKGLYKTICLIKQARNPAHKYIIPQESELMNLVNILNKACFLYPTRTKCLEWAMSLVLLALKRGWKCNLEIGVQNYPFFAHAWVECDGEVVMDDQNLREGLAIIVNEPFRRLKI